MLAQDSLNWHSINKSRERNSLHRMAKLPGAENKQLLHVYAPSEDGWVLSYDGTWAYNEYHTSLDMIYPILVVATRRTEWRERSLCRGGDSWEQDKV